MINASNLVLIYQLNVHSFRVKIIEVRTRNKSKLWSQQTLVQSQPHTHLLCEPQSRLIEFNVLIIKMEINASISKHYY